MEVFSLISSFWGEILGTIDIKLENSFDQRFSLLSLIKEINPLVLNICLIVKNHITII